MHTHSREQYNTKICGDDAIYILVIILYYYLSLHSMAATVFPTFQ